MPTVTYQDLNVDSELPAPDRFLPLWTDDYHPQPTTTQREEHYPVQSLECLGITDRRTKKEPPRVAQLTVFCNDQPPATDRQYIWCYSKDPAHKRRGSHPPGNVCKATQQFVSFSLSIPVDTRHVRPPPTTEVVSRVQERGLDGAGVQGCPREFLEILIGFKSFILSNSSEKKVVSGHQKNLYGTRAWIHLIVADANWGPGPLI